MRQYITLPNPKKSLFLFLYSLICLNIPQLKDQLNIDDQINIVVDYDDSDMSIGILNEIQALDKVSFPNSVKKIYCINAQFDKIINNDQLSENLKTDFFDEKLEVFADDYETYIFNDIDPQTVSIEYFGALEQDLFDVSHLVFKTLSKI